MQINPSVFKAYDIRGIYPKDLDEEVCYRVGRAIVAFTGARVVAVGRDARASSESLMGAVIKGIMDQGADAVDVGLVSTPMFYFSVANYDEHEAGVMITASHNPKEYNGLKMTYANALPIGEGTGMEEIKNLVSEGKFKETKKGQLSKKNVLDAYVEKILSLVNLDEIGPKKVVVDAGNAVGALSLPDIFKKTQCKLFPLYFELDGNFPNHEANPLKEETLVDLKKKVLEEKADLGVALDGDADRVGFVDEKGETVRADLIEALIAKKFLEERPGELILYDVRSSWVVKEEVERAGGRAEMCRVGHALIKKQMWDDGALFAGEFSSHFYYRDFFNVESGDLTMLKMLEIISRAGKPLSEIVAPLLRYYHSGEINFKVEDKKGVMEKLEKMYGPGAKKISHLDGIRLDFPDWWFNVRPSNTEPLLRLNLEAKTKKMMEEKKKEIADLIEEK